MNEFHKTLYFPFKKSPYEVLLYPGRYKFEAWGAQGGTTKCTQNPPPGGKGAYTSGTLVLRENKWIYVYVGQRGQVEKGSYNGNIDDSYYSYGYSSGGGATDFRLSKGEKWYDFDSLKSRIMVAAGGGGSDCYRAGAAGALVGFVGQHYSNAIQIPGVGSQIQGGIDGIYNGSVFSYPGEFGIGGSGVCPNTRCDGGGGGGSGYYGGGGISIAGGGSGGSSFISGYEGCDAIVEGATNKEEIQHSGKPYHYSGLVFSNALMIDGKNLMPSKNMTTKQTGNEDDGFAKITFLPLYEFSCQCEKFKELTLFDSKKLKKILRFDHRFYQYLRALLKALIVPCEISCSLTYSPGCGEWMYLLLPM